MKILTRRELALFEAEIAELDKTIDLCGDEDQDVVDYCESRLTEIIEAIEGSMQLARIAESGLKVVS